MLPQMTFEPAAIGVAARQSGAADCVGPRSGPVALRRQPSRGPSSRSERERPRAWRLRWSVAMVGIVLLLFASGICIIVTIHQSQLAR